MIERLKTPEQKATDALVMKLLDDLAETPTGSDEYKAVLTELERLTELRTNTRPKRVSRDTIVTAAANIIGVLAIVAYEQNHVMNPKGLSFLKKS
jgi:hypothetical protein